ncbi:hypothetical protein [uncultured Bilophila sp.]|uniref:phage baseplate plug family protein n=1 Tax=uncultured Bilophila sp. TaxID=529385 RepID=UPI00280BB281|nr:hypothetical protein [uncultured Bilophila sp.]
MQNIPLSSTPAQTFQVVLDDQQCRISLYQRGRRMYLDLDVDNEPVCRGAICQNRASIVQSPTRLFSGTLHFWDTLGDEPPRYDLLGSRFLLLYVADGEELPDALRF